MKTVRCFILILFISTVGGIELQAAACIRVACVGNSVTYGAGIKHRETNSYPAQLQRLLRDKYSVKNFGRNGATLLRKGHRPYVEQEEYKQALAFAPDRVVIHLGLNDTDPRNWPNYRHEFVADYLSLIAAFRQANPRAEIFLCRLSPISHRHPRFKAGTRDWFWQIQAAIEQVASVAKCQLIDFHTPLYDRSELLPDALHPNAEGASLLAEAVYSALTGDFGGLSLSPLFADSMVLQRDKPFVLRGKANAGESVEVKIAGQKHRTTTNARGQWAVSLAPISAGDAQRLEVQTPTRKIVIKEILMGDVWLCSGQSNMAFPLSAAYGGDTLAAQSADPSLRLYNMIPNPQRWDSTALVRLNGLDYYAPTAWHTAQPATVLPFSAVGYCFGRMLADSLRVPVGLIHNAVGGSPAESWISRKRLEFHPILVDMLYNWSQNEMIGWCRTRAAEELAQATDPLQRHPYHPSYLYRTGIEPLSDFPIKGVVWYQGESNQHNIELYEVLFPALVADWRALWGEDLPFYFVQLSSISRPSWPDFRDSQRRMAERMTGVEMVVSSDVGDSLDVHPREKQLIGRRLARAALCHSYGYPLDASGPTLREVHYQANEALLTFDHAHSLSTVAGEEPFGFDIAGEDEVFYPATVRIDGARVTLTSVQVKEPRYVRYGWQPFTRANLVNETLLPASTFTTLHRFR